MRAEFANAIIQVAKDEPRLVFLTGDLGFMALEGVRDVLGDRFINAGVAEQNMVGVAAGLAAQGMIPLVYSIAPFATLRPYEQIRNDICFHKLSVKIVGNGGGYGYGIMGSTHHVLQDIGAMRMLPPMRCYVPVFGADLDTAVREMIATPGPAYLRLNLGVKGLEMPEPFTSWRRLVSGTKGVAVTMGPVVGSLIAASGEKFKGQVDVWSAGTFPLADIPLPLMDTINKTGKLLTVEEHLSAGGLGEAVASTVLGRLTGPVQFRMLTAQGYPSERYGSQQWHLAENGLAGPALTRSLEEWLNERPYQRAS